MSLVLSVTLYRSRRNGVRNFEAVTNNDTGNKKKKKQPTFALIRDFGLSRHIESIENVSEKEKIGIKTTKL